MLSDDVKSGPSVGTYAACLLSLLVLTFLTTWIAYIDLGVFNTVVALTIAVIKASIVILFFMHVRYHKGEVRLFAGAGFLWLMILLVFVLSDVYTRGLVSG